MNLHEEHHRGRRLRPRKQPEGGQASTRRSSSIAAKHPPETTYKGGKVSAEPSETGAAKHPPAHDGKASVKVVAA